MTRFKLLIRSVRFRLGLLLVIGVIILSAYFLFVSASNHRQADDLYANRVTSRQKIFDGFIKSASDPMETFAYDYTYWDDMVEFVEQKSPFDPQFGIDNIDPG